MSLVTSRADCGASAARVFLLWRVPGRRMAAFALSGMPGAAFGCLSPRPSALGDTSPGSTADAGGGGDVSDSLEEWGLASERSNGGVADVHRDSTVPADRPDPGGVW